MQFSSALILAAVATLTTAIPTNVSPAHELVQRAPVCGYFYDEYLGDKTGNLVYGDGAVCHRLRKDGENPNGDSIYRIVLDNKRCISCEVYR
jgi:hypothetical protein